MRILSIVSCVLLTTLILGCDSVAPTAQNDASGTESTDSFAAKKTVKMVPFKGSLTGPAPSDVIVPPPPDVVCPPSEPGQNILTVTGTLVGNLTHLGLSTVSNRHCGDLNLFPNIPLFGGKGIIRAANGDEVFYDYFGMIYASFVCGVPNVFEFTGTITGGTGRFDGASGEFTWTGTGIQLFCLPPGSDPIVEASFEGQISSVGSSDDDGGDDDDDDDDDDGDDDDDD